GTAQWICIALLAVCWVLPAFVPALGTDLIALSIMAPAGIAAAVIVLLLIEQFYRNANSTGRSGFRFLAVGLGGVYAHHLLLYSHALLFGRVDRAFWVARRILTAALVPLMAIAARRNPQWSLDVFVSRQAVLFTTSILAIGVYLTLMSLGGYLLEALGGRW